MIRFFIKNNCRSLRHRIENMLADTLRPDCGWVSRHIADCPRCRRRVSRLGTVSLALSLLKTQPYSPELITRANTSAVNVLSHSLQALPRAAKLRQTPVRRFLLFRWAGCMQSVLNAAACIIIAVLLKTTAFSSIEKISKQGPAAIERYYAKQLDDQTFKDVFNA